MGIMYSCVRSPPTNGDDLEPIDSRRVDSERSELIANDSNRARPANPPSVVIHAAQDWVTRQVPVSSRSHLHVPVPHRPSSSISKSAPSSDPDSQFPDGDIVGDVTPTNDGGVIKRVLRRGRGTGRPTTGATVQIHYVGTLENGTKFDSSRDRGDQFTFNLGRGNVIRAMDLAVSTMLEGELSEFVIRSDYGYGDTGSAHSPFVPEEATLIMEVELYDWSAEDISPERDGTILRTIIVEGSRNAFPSDTSKCLAHCVGTYNSHEFYNEELDFHIGEGCEEGLPDGVEQALCRFQQGEKSRIVIRGHKYTYGSNPPAGSKIPVNGTISFLIFLKEFDEVPAPWELSTEEKLEAAKAAKDRGTHFLNKGNLKLAFNLYKRGAEILELDKSSDPEKVMERNEIARRIYLNLSIVCYKQDEQLQCIRWSDKVLETSPDHVKALYRKASALLTINDVKDAMELFEKIVGIEPANRAAAQQILECKSAIRKQNSKDRKRFKTIFARASQEEDDVDSKPTRTVEDEGESVASTSGSAHSNS